METPRPVGNVTYFIYVIVSTAGLLLHYVLCYDWLCKNGYAPSSM